MLHSKTKEWEHPDMMHKMVGWHQQQPQTLFILLMKVQDGSFNLASLILRTTHWPLLGSVGESSTKHLQNTSSHSNAPTLPVLSPSLLSVTLFSFYSSGPCTPPSPFSLVGRRHTLPPHPPPTSTRQWCLRVKHSGRWGTYCSWLITGTWNFNEISKTLDLSPGWNSLLMQAMTCFV